jgi:hypothetical protein
MTILRIAFHALEKQAQASRFDEHGKNLAPGQTLDHLERRSIVGVSNGKGEHARGGANDEALVVLHHTKRQNLPVFCRHAPRYIGRGFLSDIAFMFLILHPTSLGARSTNIYLNA